MNPQDNPPVNPQQQVIERLRTGVNVLVTVSNNPSVDQLAGAIGFTLLLNKLGKHATTVFSGTVPSTIQFLKPDETIEKNTDSLRDFIVSLDKNKADKLRYKVEQNVVKIFITPYHTSISEKDLEFSQGDFNVDIVLALGITDRKDLDQAITAHGRILHDATVITVSSGSKNSSLGAINWHDSGAASLCEMLVGVGEALQPNLLDTQAATAFLTGIVAETERFSNEKTTPKIMSLASQLMAAGANQQLIATQLDKATEVPLKPAPIAVDDVPVPNAAPADGSLTIEHTEEKKDTQPPEDTQLPVIPAAEPAEHSAEQIAIDEHGNISSAPDGSFITSKHRIIEPLKDQSETPEVAKPEEAHPFTATMEGNTSEDEDSTALPPVPARDQNMLSHDAVDTLEPLKEEPEAPAPAPYVPAPDLPGPTVFEPAQPEVTAPAPVAPIAPPVSQPEPMTLPPAFDDNTLHELEKNLDSPKFVKDPTTTLNELEEFVDSSHLTNQTTGDIVMSAPPAQGLNAARDAVSSAISSAPYDPNRPQPLQAVNALPLSAEPAVSAPQPAGMVLPPIPSTPPVADPLGQAPPPLPPPMVPMQ